MRRHRAPYRAVFWLAATCWLAAGPGGVVVQAAIACRHAAMQMPGDTREGHHMPPGGPCFCSQMVGAFDHVLSAAVPAVEPESSVIPSPVLAATDLSPIPLPPSPAFAPEPPPPIVA